MLYRFDKNVYISGYADFNKCNYNYLFVIKEDKICSFDRDCGRQSRYLYCFSQDYLDGHLRVERCYICRRCAGGIIKLVKDCPYEHEQEQELPKEEYVQLSFF